MCPLNLSCVELAKQCILLAALIICAVVFTCKSAVSGQGSVMYSWSGKGYYLFYDIVVISDNGHLDLGIERLESDMCVMSATAYVSDVLNGVLGCDEMCNEDAPTHDLCTTKIVN